MSKLRHFCLLVALTVFPLLATADNSLLMAPSSSGESSPALGAELNTSSDGEEFLPVTEAYLLSAWVRDSKLILHWDIEPGYYLYQEQFSLTRDDGTALLPSFSASEEKFDEYFEKNMAVHYTSATLTVPLSDADTPFKLKVKSQGCAEAGLCYPPHDEFVAVDPAAASVEVIDREDYKAPTTPAANGAAQPLLLTALLFALVGGAILNLMPCVFPVLSIKVLSLASADRARLALHGWAYTVGIIVCFSGFALALLAAKAGGEAIGWGFQLQSPLLVATLVYLFLVMGLTLSGVLTIGTRWMGAGQSLTQGGGLSSSFFTGVLAAVVASPCTAPFMGVALGYALTQPASVSLAIFIALGFGMALPLLLLCYFPYLIRHLPRPGPWMDVLKQALAFPLYLTAVWLVWVLGRQLGSNAIALVLLGVVAFAFGLWLCKYQPHHKLARLLLRTVAALAFISAFAIPLFGLTGTSETSRWRPYSDQLLEQMRNEGRPVFVNMTADWCLTCLANERLTLDTDEIETAFDELNVATLKGDWTNRDPAITRVLEAYGRSGVPLYLWFAPNSTGPGEILPQLLRKEHLRQKFIQVSDN